MIRPQLFTGLFKVLGVSIIALELSYEGCHSINKALPFIGFREDLKSIPILSRMCRSAYSSSRMNMGVGDTTQLVEDSEGHKRKLRTSVFIIPCPLMEIISLSA